jgi:hypothetical protein
MDDMMGEEMGGEGEAMEEEPLMEEAETPEEDKVKTLDELALDEEACLCCCCLCHCSSLETKELSCCCCFPIRCGAYTIGVITIILFSLLFLQVFYKLLNETFDWWYVMVAVILLVPFFIGCCFNIIYFAEDNNTSRSKLYVSCILTIISVLTLAFWNIFYIVFLYKSPVVQTELGPILTKKAFVVWSLYLATCFAFLWGYFTCVCKDYYEALMTYDERKAAEAKGGFFSGIPTISVPGMGDKDKMEAEAAKDAAKAPAMDAMM